jgi:hypothetical protein
VSSRRSAVRTRAILKPGAVSPRVSGVWPPLLASLCRPARAHPLGASTTASRARWMACAMRPLPCGKRWVLALLLERAAEIRCQPAWRTIRQTLDPWKVVRYRRHGTTMVHRTPVTSTLAKILRRLGIPRPKRILAVSDAAHASTLPSIHASQSPCVCSGLSLTDRSVYLATANSGRIMIPKPRDSLAWASVCLCAIFLGTLCMRPSKDDRPAGCCQSHKDLTSILGCARAIPLSDRFTEYRAIGVLSFVMGNAPCWPESNYVPGRD